MHLTQGLHRAVQQNPDLPATIDGDRVRCWVESADRVARLAAGLRAHGVRPGDRVALLALNGDLYHEVLLAVPWADAVLVPVNTRWSVPEIAFSLRDCDAAVLVVDDAFAAIVPALREQTPDLRVVLHSGEPAQRPDGAVDVEGVIAGHQPVEDARRGGDALAGIFYTGGTTGHPKGVMLSHDNVMSNILGAAAAGVMWDPGSRLLHVAPMFHLAALTGWAIGVTVGGTHVFLPGFTPGGVAAAIERHHVEGMLLVPTMIQMLVDSPDAAGADLSSLRRLLYGASPISDAVLARAAERLPGVGFTQAYGMSELSPIATLLSPTDHLDPVRRRSGGRAAPHCEVRIVDEQDRELPRGGVGQIVARGDNVMLGYWNRPEETAEALRGGWMHTGDGGYMDDHGYVYVVDRIKDMIVTGGENVYSVEVENALATHPAVASCAVIGVPDAGWGERVHAVVVLAGDVPAPDAEELREHVKNRIAGYKAPRTVEFVDALPLSGAGKVLKRELRKEHWSGAARGVS
ncbi:MAG TPA: long-chain fatty acid--CoA ligase [Pseudonocardia sp.]|nr:long-chain fatty acid--CoA ligase [Pseudonocardia sp.]